MMSCAAWGVENVHPGSRHRGHRQQRPQAAPGAKREKDETLKKVVIMCHKADENVKSNPTEERRFKVTFGKGLRQRAGTWTDRRQLTWAELTKILTVHREGGKDGPCIVTCTLRQPERKQEHAEEITLLFLDSDCGHTLAEIEAKIKQHAYAANIHSTHSHMTTITIIGRLDYEKFNGTPEQYLIEKKHYLPRVATGAKIIKEDADEVTIQHEPCPKYRVVLRLDRPWKASDYKDQEEANNAWRRHYKAAARYLGLAIDPSCSDPNRLFFLPRHKRGAQFESLVIEGSDIPICDLPVIDDEKAQREQTPRGQQTQPGEQPDVIGTFNRQVGIEKVLERNGYKKIGNKYLAPSSSSKEPGVSIKEGRAYSHHQSDPLYGGDDRRSRDAFETFRILEHNGDMRSAIKAAAKELGIERPKSGSGKAPSKSTTGSAQEAPPVDWEAVSEVFPRTDYPWEVLPKRIARHLKQLARACASSPNALPGAACCILASTVGRLASVSPKDSWEEPLIIWHGHVSPSGTGKTPAPRMLAEVLHESQAKEHKRWAQEMEEFRRLPKKEQREAPLPVKERGYFCTNLTLEGVRDDLDGHPTGGVVVIQDELSAFIGGQNEYKQRGTDRESWLTLWDGKPARIVRKDRSVFITGARVSVFGGIQPAVFGRVFGSDENGLYLADGTIFRFLIVSEGVQFHELTAESWADDARASWEALLVRSIHWADGLVRDDASQRLIFDREAQDRFLDWRNDREGIMGDLPPALRGFLPKAYSYALRLAGVIHCLHRFDAGKDPDTVLDIDDIERGIKVAEFHLGQTVDAFQMLGDVDHSPDLVDERVTVLAQVLESQRGQVDSGRLAVGFVCDRYNERQPAEQRFRTPKAFGAFIRSLGLSISEGLHDANGRSRSHCVLWDAKIISFLETRLASLGSLKNPTQQCSVERDIENTKSRKSRSLNETEQVSETCETLKNQSLGPQVGSAPCSGDMRDMRDDFPKEEEILI